MVADERGIAVNPAVTEEAWWGMGHPTSGGVLIVGDHASARVPVDIDLGIDAALLTRHIALDIGVDAVASRLVGAGSAHTALLGGVSRLVLDLNREEDAPGLIPLHSDGHAIPGNNLSAEARLARIERFHRPYHAQLELLVRAARPAMILSLHSFTPRLASNAEEVRPWQVGILYNQDDRLARVAIDCLQAEGVNVGDQLPYSGKVLNYTMNRHAEAHGIPYLGVEMRQDLVADASGVGRMAQWLERALDACRNYLAESGVDVK